MITQNDFLAGAKFGIKNGLHLGPNVSVSQFFFVPAKKRSYIASRNFNFRVIEIDKDGFCVQMKNQPHRIDFSDCSLIEDAE